ncbi:MAG: hypothetical protein JWQ78_1262 [Sediminibacterium sp.]|nr:hypothetical protein [Sediminibacterium sp.]
MKSTGYYILPTSARISRSFFLLVSFFYSCIYFGRTLRKSVAFCAYFWTVFNQAPGISLFPQFGVTMGLGKKVSLHPYALNILKPSFIYV